MSEFLQNSTFISKLYEHPFEYAFLMSSYTFNKSGQNINIFKIRHSCDAIERDQDESYLAGCSRNITLISCNMCFSDVRYYITGEYERAEWDIVLALTRINKAGMLAWGSYPIDYWLIDALDLETLPRE